MKMFAENKHSIPIPRIQIHDCDYTDVNANKQTNNYTKEQKAMLLITALVSIVAGILMFLLTVILLVLLYLHNRVEEACVSKVA